MHVTVQRCRLRVVSTLSLLGLLVASASAPAAVAGPRPQPPASRQATAALPSSNSSTASQLARQINAFIAQPRFATARWGISVVSLDTGQSVYAHHADKLAIPASNAKLYTAALALSALGTSRRIRTTLYASAAPHGGVIDGDLILYGRGDPTLGTGSDTRTPTAWADHLASALAKRGIQRIHGSLIADDSFFSGPPIAPGWEARDLQTWFVPPASALTVRGNMFLLHVGPSDGLCCDVRTTPAMPELSIVNLAQTDASASVHDLGVYRPAGSRQVYVYGAMRPHAHSRRIPLAAPDPALMAGRLLEDALVRHGIHVDGGVQALHWPRHDDAIGAPHTVKLAEVRSPPIRKIVRHALKHSDNLYAQLLLLQAGAHFADRGTCKDRTEQPRTTNGWGLCAMRAMLRRIGIGANEARFEEGSGLSRKDLVTPQATTRLLRWASRQPFATALREALPIAGVDGTLKRRMRGTRASDNVQAKTGTLRYSYTLSGYVTTAGSKHLVFSLMLEDYARPRTRKGRHTGPSPRQDLDAVATILANAVSP